MFLHPGEAKGEALRLAASQYCCVSRFEGPPHLEKRGIAHAASLVTLVSNDQLLILRLSPGSLLVSAPESADRQRI